MNDFDKVREHMTIVGAEGAKLGTVDRIEGDRIKMTREDSGVGQHDHHHYIPRGLVAAVDGDTVRLSAKASVVADLFEQEENGQPLS